MDAFFLQLQLVSHFHLVSFDYVNIALIIVIGEVWEHNITHTDTPKG